MTQAPIKSGMSEAERELLATVIGGAEPRLTLRTGTRIDTGRWLLRSPLWLCVTDERVVVLAASRRSYCESVERSACGASHYNHTTGQLVIEPAERLKFPRVSLSPSDALRVLGLITSDDPSDTTQTSSSLETEPHRA